MLAKNLRIALQYLGVMVFLYLPVIFMKANVNNTNGFYYIIVLLLQLCCTVSVIQLSRLKSIMQHVFSAVGVFCYFIVANMIVIMKNYAIGNESYREIYSMLQMKLEGIYPIYILFGLVILMCILLLQGIRKNREGLCKANV